MVYHSPISLNATFAALADPTRRALLARLSESEAVSISDLAKPFAMSLPAIMKHLDVLKDAGLVASEKSGRVVSCRLRAEPMREANEWLNRYQRFWNDRLDQLAAFLEEDSCPQPLPSSQAPRQASPSSGASMPLRKKSLAPGPTRKK
ncbi:MAG: metalloregulator ArsR/SmtB family transcription factor [Pseudolabrys sp.]|jgi:DNA-binding transcriptional ArsR family regulator